VTPTKVVVLGCPGREDVTARTLADLDGNGGGRALRIGEKWLHWSGATPPPEPPQGWLVEWSHKSRDGARVDTWRMLRWAGDCDLVYIEDDVLPCKNALPYMFRWSLDRFTTFHNLRSLPVGPWMIDGSGFWGTQAVKIPRRLLARLQAEGADRPRQPHFGQDMVMSDLLAAWGEPIYVHRSLVQHVGAKSIHSPRSKLVGGRAPAKDFPGVDFDAMAVPF